MITHRPYCISDRDTVIQIIDRVAAEGRYLQTDRFRPSFFWNQMLEHGMDLDGGFALRVVQDYNHLVGFIRLFPEEQTGRSTGNVGIVLLPDYRYKRIGTGLLEFIVRMAGGFGFSCLTADILFDNFISLRLFQGQGFMEDFRRNLFLGHRNSFVEEVRMRLFLKGRWNVQVPND